MPILATGVVVVVAVLLVLLVAIQNGRVEALRASEAATANLARALADGSARLMESVEATVTFAAEVLETAPGLEVSETLERQIAQRLSQTPILRQILVLDGDGRVLFDTSGEATGRNLDVAAYGNGFDTTRRALRLGDVEEKRFIGGRTAAGRTLFPVVRRLGDLDGAPRGMIIAAVNPAHFLAIGATLDLGDDPWVALYRYDGAPLSGGDGHRLSPDVVAALRRREEAGTRTVVMADGRERIVSYRATPVWPLVVEIGVTTETALTAWRRSLPRLVVPVSLISLTVLVLTVALVWAARRRASDEAALRLSDEVLRNIRGGVVIADRDLPGHPIIYTNDALERITGVTAQMLNRRLAAFTDGGIPDPAADASRAGEDPDPAGLIADLIGSGPAERVERRAFRRDGERVWVDVVVTGVDDPRARRDHVVVVMHDVSERVRYERELRRSFDELASLHGEQERFSEILTHHLQEPVRRIVVHGQLLRRAMGDDGTLPEAAREALSVLDVAGRRLRHLLRDVELYISAGRRGVGDPAAGQESASVAVALNWVLAKFRFALEDAGVQVVRNPLPEVAMGMASLREVLHALVDNAIRYRAPDRQPIITVDAGRHDGEWVICVEDNGVGIDSDQRERVFRVFERLDVGGDHEGTGIGLALARKLVERHGGRIWIDSESGRGTRVYFTVPVIGNGTTVTLTTVTPTGVPTPDGRDATS